MKNLDQEDCLPILVRRINDDVVEVRSRNFMFLVRWLLLLLLAFCLLYSAYGNIRHAMTHDKTTIQVIPFLFIEKNIDWVCCIDDVLKHNFERFGQGNTFEEYIKRYNVRVYQAWGNLFFWALLLVPFLLPNPRAIRFDRKRGVIYSQNWRGKFFAAPVHQASAFMRSFSLLRELTPLKYLNSTNISEDTANILHLQAWQPCLYQRKRNGKPRTMVKELGAFPPTMAMPSERYVLYHAINQFMMGNDEKLIHITSKYKRHHYWVGRLFNATLFGTRTFNEKKLNRQLETYQQHWDSLSEQQQQQFLDKTTKVKKGYTLSSFQGLFTMLTWLALWCTWIYIIAKYL